MRVHACVSNVDGDEVVSHFHLADFENKTMERMFKLIDLIHETAIEITGGDPTEAALILAYAAGNITSMAGLDRERVVDFLHMGIEEYKGHTHDHEHIEVDFDEPSTLN